MKLQVLSDLHLELHAWRAPATGADVVVLAGDIAAQVSGLDWAASQSAFVGKPIVYVIGNHEYYGTEFLAMRTRIRRRAEALQQTGRKIFVLDNDALVLDGVRFLGSTLWTDYQLFGDDIAMALAMSEARRRISDHSCILLAGGEAASKPSEEGFRPFLPRDAAAMNRLAYRWLGEQLVRPHAGPTVVVTHHLPSKQSVAPRFESDVLSAAFASNLDELVVQADLWIHGHTHDVFDYQLGQCRVVCNPRGYPSEVNGFRPDLVIEV